MNSANLRILALVLIPGLFAIAEPSPTGGAASNPFDGQTIYRPYSPSGQQNDSQNPANLGGSGLAGGIFNGVRNDPNAIGAVQSNRDGRADKAREGKKTATDGSEAAIAVGATMIGIGVPMIPVPIISVSVAGIILLTNGIIELAQGAASANASKQNAKAESVLRMNEGAVGNQATSKASANASGATDPALREKLLTPALRSELEKNGTDPERFADEMLGQNGARATEENVARALGVSAETMAKGKAEGSLNLVADEMARTSGAVLAAFSGGLDSQNNSGLSGTSASNELLASNNAETQATASSPQFNIPRLPAQLAEPALTTILHPAGPDFLANLYVGAGGFLEPGMEPSKSDLMSIGIRTPFKRNIFQIARSEYHNFGKWRDPSVANSH